MSDQPKPASGEWTADTVFTLLMSQEDDHMAHEAIADAHNAALSAEREHCRLALLDCSVKNTDLALALNSCEQQLAAEREKIAPPVDNKYVAEGCAQFGEVPASTEAVFIMNRQLMLEVEQLRTQLAAEERRANDSIEENVRLMNRLAAEREKRKLSEREWCGLVQQLREELAAEREKYHVATQNNMWLNDKAVELEKQLAAERERYGALEKSILDLSHPNCKDLLQQLAAERER